jgi:hypothetical protein
MNPAVNLERADTLLDLRKSFEAWPDPLSRQRALAAVDSLLAELSSADVEAPNGSHGV